MTTLAKEIIRLAGEGKSYNQIKESLGCSKGTISYHLGAGQKEKTIERSRDRRNKIRAYIQDYKQSHSCKDCGENYPYWMMDFDHLGDKEFNIGQFSTATESIENIKREIEKCDVVCANCHRNRTHLRLVKSGSDTVDLSSYYE